MKYGLYVDETGDPSLKAINESFPIFVLVGCLFDEEAYSTICAKIQRLKRELFGSEHVVLHSREIRKCEGVFSCLFDLEVKKLFYERLNDTLVRAAFTVIAVAIKKQEFIDKYGKIADDPYELSLSFLLERAVMATDSGRENSLYVTAESRGKKEDAILHNRYNRLLDVGSGHITPTRFKSRIAEFRFRKKEDNDCGLQIADLCAYPIARHILFPNLPSPAFEIVEKKLRKGSNGSALGYGLKIFP